MFGLVILMLVPSLSWQLVGFQKKTAQSLASFVAFAPQPVRSNAALFAFVVAIASRDADLRQSLVHTVGFKQLSASIRTWLQIQRIFIQASTAAALEAHRSISRHDATIAINNLALRLRDLTLSPLAECEQAIVIRCRLRRQWSRSRG